ncbi:NADPH-dependent FMN reductase [Niallia sp. FSL W8-0635]|uniref:NADPH-dependent FMN reductase n=1 Tax=Niallia sp. FSL W8-0635 TaxID=2975337 RepID=UPI0009CE6047|nr:NADPH-dependent FMN reductase [Mycobacteroides abscessus subsp. abscessus]HEO8422133.1 NAD(P)H-dependent oxidoreductase [Yersinia enterocolitica]
MKLVGISGSLVGSKTSKAVNEVLVAAKSLDPTIQVELIDLREFDIEFVNGAPLSYYNDDTIKVVNTILASDALVIGTPVYQASITGVLKNLFDHLPVDAFKSKVTGMVITGGTDKHFLVMEYQLKPILTYFKGLVTVQNVFVHNDYFDDENEITDEDVKKRMAKLAEEIVYLKR